MMSRKFLYSATFVFLILACASEKSEFHKAERADSIEAFQAFIAKYPQGKLLPEATKKIHQLAYESAKAKDSLQVYLEFQQKYPETEFTTIVNERIAELEFQIVKAKDSLHVYLAYRAKYPESPFLGEIDERIEAIYNIEFDKAKKENAVEAITTYIKNYPDSPQIKAAQAEIARLNAPKVENLSGEYDCHYSYTFLSSNGSMSREMGTIYQVPIEQKLNRIMVANCPGTIDEANFVRFQGCLFSESGTQKFYGTYDKDSKTITCSFNGSIDLSWDFTTPVVNGKLKLVKIE